MYKTCVRGMSTIYALSSGAGKSAIAVVRISGPSSKETLRKLTGKDLWTARHLTLANIKAPDTQELLDRALVAWFPAPFSYTGEDSAELHLHGGPAVIRGVLQALSNIPSLRPSQPGEFSRRAFINGKLDLTAIEGIGDLISAETSLQRRLALRQAGGELRNKCKLWREKLIKAVAHLEAYIDFGEEEEIETEVFKQVLNRCWEVEEEMWNCLKRGGERIREGVTVVIVGRPNVGKSSLLNMLCQRDAAIVSHNPGTTRDTLEAHLDLNGLAVNLTDTAGLRETTQDIEREGIRRARNKMGQSDVVLLVMDAHLVDDWKTAVQQEIRDLEIDVTKEHSQIILVANKTDLMQNSQIIPDHLELQDKHIPILSVSCVLNQSHAPFLDNLGLYLNQIFGECSGVILSHERHRVQISRAVESLKELRMMDAGDSVLAAHKLRNSMHSIAAVTGFVCTEQILDVIFSDFCIGK